MNMMNELMIILVEDGELLVYGYDSPRVSYDSKEGINNILNGYKYCVGNHLGEG